MGHRASSYSSYPKTKDARVMLKYIQMQFDLAGRSCNVSRKLPTLATPHFGRAVILHFEKFSLELAVGLHFSPAFIYYNLRRFNYGVIALVIEAVTSTSIDTTAI